MRICGVRLLQFTGWTGQRFTYLQQIVGAKRGQPFLNDYGGVLAKNDFLFDFYIHHMPILHRFCTVHFCLRETCYFIKILISALPKSTTRKTNIQLRLMCTFYAHYLSETHLVFLFLTRCPPIGGRQNATPLKFDRKPSEAAFSAILRTSINADLK